MAITVVQTVSSGAAVSNGPHTVTAGANFTVGNLLVVHANTTQATDGSFAVSSPAVSGGLTLGPKLDTFGTVGIFYGVIDTSGQTTVSISGTAGNFPCGNVFELSGVNATPLLTSGTLSQSGLSPTLTCPSLSATAAGQFYLGGGFVSAGVPTGNTPTAGFSELEGDNVGSDVYQESIYQVTTGSGSLAPTITANGFTGGSCVAVIFNAVAAAGTARPIVSTAAVQRAASW